MRYICSIIYPMFKLVKLHRFLLVSVLVVISGLGLAQDALKYETKALTHRDSSVASMEEQLSASFQAPISMRKVQSKKSPIGVHDHFQIEINGLPIYEGLVIRSRFNQGNASICYPKLSLMLVPYPSKTNHARVLNFIESFELFESIYQSGYQIVIIDNIPTLSFIIKGKIEGFPQILILDEKGDEINRKDLTRFNKPDSLVRVMVFLPDPLTRGEKAYGNPLYDNDDANAIALNDLRVEDSILVRWDSNTLEWVLESDYFQGIDLDAIPNGDAPTSINGRFDFGRGEFGFEYVNAFYHIHRQQERMQELGFTDLANYPIKVDAHYGLADQSSFSFDDNSQTGVLRFGDGGVDDAEDADVIVHEYTHALNYSINSSPVSGNEREAIEEGNCDFIALTYSRAISQFGYDKIFNWDGHNEFWTGRSLTNSRSYPSDLENYLYDDAPIWTSALADVEDYYGRTVSEKLLFTSIYSYFPYMTMTHAASLFLQADSALYDAEHAEVISIIFCNRGLLEGCQDSLVNDRPLSDPYLASSEAFAANTGKLRLFPNKRELLSIELIDLTGKRIARHEFSNDGRLFYELDFPQLAAGYYVLWVQTNAGSFAFKLLKQNE